MQILVDAFCNRLSLTISQELQFAMQLYLDQQKWFKHCFNMGPKLTNQMAGTQFTKQSITTH